MDHCDQLVIQKGKVNHIRLPLRLPIRLHQRFWFATRSWVFATPSRLPSRTFESNI